MIDAFSSNIRVLHVDDEPGFAKMAGEFLEREDDRIDVETVTSASEGLDRLADAEFDCVVSDYDMPELDGLEFLETVRNDWPDLPFILFTGKGSEEVASDAISAGVTDYLQKESSSDQYTVLANRIANAVESVRSRRMVKQSEQRLRDVVDSLPHLLHVVDADGTYLLANEALADFHDTTVSDIEGSNLSDMLPEAQADEFRDYAATVLEEEETMHLPDLEVPDANDDIHILESRLLPYDFGETDGGTVLGIAADVTEQRERERSLQHALEYTNSIIFGIDLDTGALTRYGTYERFFDNPPEKLSTWQEYCEKAVHPDDRAAFRRFYRRFVDGDQTSGKLEYRTNPETGDVRWIESNVHLRDDTVTDRRVLGISQDVTNRKERECELERKERRYQAIFNDPNILVGLLDTDGSVLDINQTAMDYVDIALDDLTGEPFWEAPWFSHSETVQEDVRDWIDLAARGEYVEFDLDLVDPSGDPYVIEGVIRPVTDDDGEVVSLIISDREVTDQREYERELEEVNAIQSTLLDTLPVGVLVEDTSRNVVAVNDHFFDLFDLPTTPDEIIGADCSALAADVGEIFTEPEAFADRIEKVMTDGDPVRNEELHLRDGRTFARSYQSIGLPEGEGHLWVYRDITDSKRREARLEALNTTTQDLMAAETLDEVAEIGVNAADEILGMEASSIHLYDEERSALVPRAITDAATDLVGDPPTFTAGDSIAWRAYEDGEPLAVDDVHDDPDAYNPDSAVRSELFLPLGDYGILIAGSDTPAAFDLQDRVFGELLAGNIAAALEQVEQTEQLRAREQELMRQNDRLEAFASVVSHDLRNPLNVADGRLELAREVYDSDDLDAVDRALDRMDALIDDLLTLAREGDPIQELEPVDIGALARGCWANVETGNARLDVANETTIQADRSRLKQLLENLFRNAVEHGGADVTVTVGGTADGFYVEDDGPGIPPADRERVLEPGYSTSQEGTGFGLSIVKEIVDGHGWDIEITDSEAAGVRFEISGVASE
jgi:PAS domain S-box-containing protein